MTDKPTFMRVRPVLEPLQAPRKHEKEPKGMCPICGRGLEEGVVRDVHAGVCKTVMDKGSYFEKGTVVLGEAVKESIKSIYEKHVRSL